MKTKFFSILLMTVAFSASAASIDWELNTGRNGYMTDSTGAKLTGTAYLMLTDTLTGVSFTSEQDIVDLALGGSSGSLSIANGVNKTTMTSTDDRLTAPTSYSFTVLVFDSVNKEYFLSSAANSETAYNLSGDEYTDAKTVSFSASQMYADATTRNTQTYVPVPEPSVALMGLIGIGMLIRRRKA